MANSRSSYTHGYHHSVLRSHQNRTIENSALYLLPELAPDLHLLDVGSGAGTITADFAKTLSAGSVTALELTEPSLSITQNEIERHALSNVDFVIGDIHTLPFPDKHFDIVHAHQVLQHVSHPVQALREMKRVCKPGGVVAARDSDYAGFIWFPQLPELDEWMHWYQQAARANNGEPNAGRYLLSWAQEAGFTDITSTSSTWCYSTPDTRQWWGSMWAERIGSSQIAEQLRQQGIATQQDLDRIAAAWRYWTTRNDGWMSLVHGEILCRV